MDIYSPRSKWWSGGEKEGINWLEPELVGRLWGAADGGGVNIPERMVRCTVEYMGNFFSSFGSCLFSAQVWDELR